MASICEHKFEPEDPRAPGYSMTEVDLAARLGMTIRKNHRRGVYEIIYIRDKHVVYQSPRLEDVAGKANALEEADYIEVACGSECMKRRQEVRS